MLHNYLIDILIMMLNIIASYNKLLYAIINTQYKITTSSKINFAKTHHFEIWSFLEYQEFWNFCCEWGGGEWGGRRITIFSHSAENIVRWIIILSHSVEKFVRWITILRQSPESSVGYLRV